MKLESKIALVTGGAVRIGRRICEALAARGCDVIVHYDRSGKEAADLVGRIRQKGVEAYALRAHFATENACRKLMDAAWKKAGHVDFLINNAAVFHKDDLMSATEKKIVEELRANFMTPLWLTAEFAKRIPELPGKQQKAEVRGKVINLLDQRIAGNSFDCVPYLLSKKMLAEFTEMAALKFAPSITVNGIAPGAVLPANIRAESSGRRKGRGLAGELAGEIPLVSRPAAEDVAAAVVFLLESDSITGQTIFVDGGQHLIS
jgi:pteridine reductase